jgi:4-hydroxy-3-polyprenylbenzoate decarboxylase
MAVTGASGAVYARRLARGIVDAGAHLHLVVSPYGQRVFADELGVRRLTLEALLGTEPRSATAYSYRDLGAKIASGSFHTDGMVICPCSSNTLAGVAAGLAGNLVTRAALVTLKEARRLILVTREMPLSQIELANMLRVSQSGGIICPASPAFYLMPSTIDDLVAFVVARVLDLLGLPHALSARWDPHARGAQPGPSDTEAASQD